MNNSRQCPIAYFMYFFSSSVDLKEDVIDRLVSDGRAVISDTATHMK